jgi:hypothetical protein
MRQYSSISYSETEKYKKSAPIAQIIPVKCGAAATCSPVTEEEKAINLEVFLALKTVL